MNPSARIFASIPGESRRAAKFAWRPHIASCLPALLLLVLLPPEPAAAAASRPTSAPTLSTAQWLATIQEQIRALPADDDDTASLLRGASLATGPYSGLPDNLAKFNGRNKADYERFQRYMADRGDALIAQFRRTGSLADIDPPDRYILHRLTCFRFQRQYTPLKRQGKPLAPEAAQDARHVESAIANGYDALQRAYKTGMLSADDIEQLRLYAMYVDVQCTGGRLLPYHFALTGAAPPRPGDPAPDFTLLRHDAALRSPRYSDLNPHDLTHVFKPHVLLEILQLLQGYEPTGDGCRPRPVAVPPGQEKDYVRLSDFRGKKPVVLIFADPTDVWAWHWTLAPMLQGLHRAYRDRAEFIVVSTTVHDTYMSVNDYFGPTFGRNLAVHPLTVEERARTSKMLCMWLPTFRIPYLMDDMSQRARNAYHDEGGAAAMYIVGVDGIIAYEAEKRSLPGHFASHVPGGLGFYEEFREMRVNFLEVSLRHILANGGKHVPDRPLPPPAWRKRTLTPGTIAAIDPQLRRVTVRPTQADARPLTMDVGQHTRIMLNGRRATLADLKADMPVTADHWADQAGDPTPARALLAGVSPATGRATIWMTRHIRDVHVDTRQVSALVEPMAEDDLTGMRFWKEAGDRAQADPHTAAALAIVRKWLGDDPDGRRYRFVVDDGAYLFVNGKPGTFADLQAGDRVAVQYRTMHDADELIAPDHICVMRPLETTAPTSEP